MQDSKFQNQGCHICLNWKRGRGMMSLPIFSSRLNGPWENPTFSYKKDSKPHHFNSAIIPPWCCPFRALSSNNFVKSQPFSSLGKNPICWPPFGDLIEFLPQFFLWKWLPTFHQPNQSYNPKLSDFFFNIPTAPSFNS